ncbi:hypothetical protein E2542_SST19810 [Spatholobus suberectus]|nr:hypothetical protein E2542_SST19810 [Spatholobus suberectus]
MSTYSRRCHVWRQGGKRRALLGVERKKVGLKGLEGDWAVRVKMGRGEVQGGFLVLDNATDDKVDESDDEYCKSLGNIKDESVDNVDEITMQEKEESDDNLKTRIERFIAQAYKGWIEESHWDKYGIDI